ncbi:hypothetical protein SDC9_141655 [bioreactor metagenome]|uniref:Uncharacterized protein n=1 Tax=bioreactor metagenome TaxID=1076179 RepID=A0A645DZ13_9ZZZZ
MSPTGDAIYIASSRLHMAIASNTPLSFQVMVNLPKGGDEYPAKLMETVSPVGSILTTELPTSYKF